jgi:hypothetical protein
LFYIPRYQAFGGFATYALGFLGPRVFVNDISLYSELSNEMDALASARTLLSKWWAR